MASIQSSYTSPSKCICSSSFGNLISCSPLTSYLCSFSCLSYGNVNYGTSIVYLVACTIVGIACNTTSTTNGSTLPRIIFCAFTFVLSYSLFISELNVPPSSTMFFLLRTFLGVYCSLLFVLNVIYISSLVLLTLVDGFYGFSF